jgi:hypothetical protein
MKTGLPWKESVLNSSIESKYGSKNPHHATAVLQALLEYPNCTMQNSHPWQRTHAPAGGRPHVHKVPQRTGDLKRKYRPITDYETCFCCQWPAGHNPASALPWGQRPLASVFHCIKHTNEYVGPLGPEFALSACSTGDLQSRPAPPPCSPSSPPVSRSPQPPSSAQPTGKAGSARPIAR